MSDNTEEMKPTVETAPATAPAVDATPAEDEQHSRPMMPSADNTTGRLPDAIVRKWMNDVKQFMELWKDSQDFDVQLPYLVELGFDEPFLGSLSRRILKTKTGILPTAGVRIANGGIELLWNPIFFKHELYKQSREFPRGVLKHELFHVILEHCTDRRQEPHTLWNAATDCAINSLIPRTELPKFCLQPGELYVPEDAPKDWKPSIIARIIKEMPREKSSEWYFSHFMQHPEIQQAMQRAEAATSEEMQEGDGQPQSQPGGSGGSGAGSGKSRERVFDKNLRKELYGGDGGQFDDHDMWDDLSDADRDMMRDYMRDMFRDCVREAERQNNGWGSVPSSIQQHLKKIISREVDWRELMNQFIGRSRSTMTTSSLKRINRRAPWDYPGRKRMHRARPVLLLDQSGSMADWWIELLFAEMSNLGSLTEYVIIPFDYTVDEQNIQVIRRGQQPTSIRTRQGGTSFDAPVQYVNEHRSEYDCAFILTDGGCSAPRKCDIPLAYILAPGCELMFDPGDTMVIKMTDTRRK